jgi:CBS domain-containing protein
MTKQPKLLRSRSNLAAKVELMWSSDGGVPPFMDDGKLSGIITDRDMLFTLGTRNPPAAEIAVKDLATREVQTCASRRRCAERLSSHASR